MSDNTPHVLHLLSEYFDALLPEKEHHDVAAHIKDCAECEKRFQELVRLRKMLHELPALTPPSGFYSDVVKKIKGANPLSEAMATGVPLKVLMAACVVMVVVWVSMAGLDNINFKFWMRTEMPPPVTKDMHPPKPLVDQIEQREQEIVKASNAPLLTSTETGKVIDSTAIANAGIVPKPQPPVLKTRLTKKTSKTSAPHSKHKEGAAPGRDIVTRTSVKGSSGPSKQDLLKTPRPTGEKARLVELEARHEVSQPSEFLEWKGMDSGIKKFRKYVIQSPAQMKEVWARHAPNAPVPAVDFKRYQVVGVTTGLTHLAGTGYEIIGSRDTLEATIVYYRERKDMLRVQPSVSGYKPYHFKVIPDSRLPVKFQQI